MRKAYIQPDAKIVSISALDDFLSLSLGDEDDNPLVVPDDTDMEGSEGEIVSSVPGIW